MATPVIRVEHVGKRLNGTEVLRDVSFQVMSGEIFVLMGPSGTGKSVLLKNLIGLLRPDTGAIYIWDEPVHQMGEEEFDRLRLRMGVVFQSTALFDSLTVGENIAFPMRRHRQMSRRMIRTEVMDLLALVGLEQAADRLPAMLSGGMRKRVAIARALALDPDLVFYDEPTAGLDPPTSRDVDALIAMLGRELGVTSVVVTHDLATAFGIADRLAVLAQGQVLALGTPAEVRADRRPVVQHFINPGGVEERL
jgi:phospholipid/cholesterol/gamma-HCH transport system ATP-binding protein